MATTALTVKTSFTAVDKFTATIKKMTAGVRTFGQKSVATFHKIDRAQRRFQKNISNSIGKIGRLGLAFSGAALAATILAANVELDKNLASLSAITGVTGDAFNDFTKEIENVSKSEKVFAANTAKAFELVGSAKPELLSSAENLGKVSKSAIILSKASGDQLAPSVASLTNVLNQFELGAGHSTRAMNVLAAASVVGDTKISQTSEAFKVAGSEAKMSGLNIEELSATVATFSKFGFKGAEAGTKFRNILSKMSLGKALPKEAVTRLKDAGVNIDLISDKSVSYVDRLKELSKIQNNSAALAKVFGEENKGVASILLNNIPLLEENIKGVTGTNAAVDQAAIKSNTLANRWEDLTNSFKNAVTTTDSENKSLLALKNILKFAADNMDVLIGVLGGLIAILGTFKIVMATVNFVLSASPLTWITLGIVLLIAAVAALVIYWEEIVNWVKTSDNVFAKLIRFVLKPIMWLFRKIGDIISWLVQKWEDLVEWVKTSDSAFAQFVRGGISQLIAAFETLGKIIDWISEKWDKMMGLMGRARESIAEFAIEKGALEFLSPEQQKRLLAEASLTELGVINAESNQGVNLNPDAANSEAIQKNVLKLIQDSNIKIDVNDRNNNTEVSQSGSPIKLSKTVGFQK